MDYFKLAAEEQSFKKLDTQTVVLQLNPRISSSLPMYEQPLEMEKA